ncbi:1-acyl-sn-glycerol-3-phosphate acyltransferase [Azospirillum agricola]|uniref:lysophospholipid acyltransferase family protein n=1 Tax=Azospirillum agricola TaxID=1720247 RepID=UPI001AE6A2F3|nr:lysophospholipid acyltransferase family protein [Azospirillum agricola]MBP2229529.1 1-acyl-sn-glycerol-3-phosphate acyltransferase [Azospirillum agricola]
MAETATERPRPRGRGGLTLAGGFAGLAGAVRRGWEYPLFYLLLLLFGLMSLAWSLTAALLDPLLPRRIARPLGRFAIRSGFRGYLGVLRACGILKTDLSALDALKGDEGLVLCPNHPSLLDAVLLISHLPNVACIAKAKVYDNLCLGGGARMAGYIRNDSPASLVKLAAREVRAGRQLLIFPEGTRTARPPVGALKGGFALIAKTAGAPVQTVLIDTNTRFLGKGWPLFRKPEFPLVYTVRLGRRFEPPADVRRLVDDLEGYYRSQL